MLNPNSTKSVFWLIVILAVAGSAVALFAYSKKKHKKVNAPAGGTEEIAGSDSEDAPAE